MVHQKRHCNVGGRVDRRLDVGLTTLPTGRALPNHKPAKAAESRVLTGKFVTLRPLKPASDAEPLFRDSHGHPEAEAIWTYMGYGPFPDPSAMREFLTWAAGQQDSLFFAVERNTDGQPIGMCSYLRAAPEHGRIEIGHIWYGFSAQRTAANTEAAYLLLNHAFEGLGHRRLEWKCDALNQRSRQAALRLGFHFEGIFHDHLVYKGRNRDTAWFAMLAGDWPLAKRALELWIDNYPERKSLVDIRSALQG
jgi:RimJ/RimL family protein N-acetyltransferase